LDVIKMLRTTPLIVRSSILLLSRNERTRSTINNKKKSKRPLLHSPLSKKHTHTERKREKEPKKKKKSRERGS